MLRTLLILAIVLLAARYIYKLFWTRGTERRDTVHGSPRSASRNANGGRVEDADFKDLPDK